MRTLCLFLLASLPLCAQGVQRDFVSKGRTIHYSAVVFDPPKKITAENGPMDQASPLNCVRLFWSRLSNLDIAGAAQLNTDPAREIELRSQYKERVGEQASSQMYAKVFNDGGRFLCELVIDKTHALVNDKYSGSLFLFIERDGKFWIDNTETGHRSQQANDLITLQNAFSDGKLNLRP